MSSRRSSRSRQRSSPAVTDDDEQIIVISDLVMKLRALLPARSGRRNPAHADGGDRSESAAKVLQETCDYIRRLQQEVGDLSEQLCQLLPAAEDQTADEAAIGIRSLLM